MQQLTKRMFKAIDYTVFMQYTKFSPRMQRQMPSADGKDGNCDDFVAMAGAMTHHNLRTVIDRIFPFEELHLALEYMATGKHSGKICIKH